MVHLSLIIMNSTRRELKTKSYGLCCPIFKVTNLNGVKTKVTGSHSTGSLWELFLSRRGSIREDGEERGEIVTTLGTVPPPLCLPPEVCLANKPPVLWNCAPLSIVQSLAVTSLSLISPGVRYKEWTELFEWLARVSLSESHQGRRRIVLGAAGPGADSLAGPEQLCFARHLGSRSDCEFEKF